jgi:hypothetical protein
MNRSRVLYNREQPHGWGKEVKKNVFRDQVVYTRGDNSSCSRPSGP